MTRTVSMGTRLAVALLLTLGGVTAQPTPNNNRSFVLIDALRNQFMRLVPVDHGLDVPHMRLLVCSTRMIR